MRSILVMSAGVLMILSSGAHAFLGWPQLQPELSKAGVVQPLLGAVAVGWYFGSVAMLTFGVVVLLMGLRLKRGDRSGVLTVRIVAAAYLLFGLTVFVLRDFNPHFLVFVFTGLLTGIPVLSVKTD